MGNDQNQLLREALEAMLQEFDSGDVNAGEAAALDKARAALSPPALFASQVAARKWGELQANGHRMQSIAFDGGKGGAGSIDPWGVVLWGNAAASQAPATEAVAGDGWPKLDKPARVGNMTFGAGGSARLVVRVAQRLCENGEATAKLTKEQLIEEERKRRALFDMIHGTVAGDVREAVAWLPIETAPMDGRKIILFYRNSSGNARTVMARYLTDEQAAATDADGVGLEGGWYESIDNWGEYTEVAINEGEPTHWMPLPKSPSATDTTPPAPPQPLTRDQIKHLATYMPQGVTDCDVAELVERV